MKINCLSCGHKVELDDAYDDYAGQIKCLACHAIMEIENKEGKLKSAKLAWSVARPAVEDRRKEPCLKQC
jgi:DNA-directed RNA polymerase subunit RPC12/RpoP